MTTEAELVQEINKKTLRFRERPNDAGVLPCPSMVSDESIAMYVGRFPQEWKSLKEQRLVFLTERLRHINNMIHQATVYGEFNDKPHR